MPRVFVIGHDWTFRVAVRAELLELGLEALGFSAWPETRQSAREAMPDVIVVDASSIELPAEGLHALAPVAQYMVITGASVPPHLPAAAAVLRKPVRAGEIAAAVRLLLEGHPA